MKSRTILVVSALLLGVLAGGITSSLLAQSGRPVQTAATQTVAVSGGQTWEYRILGTAFEGGGHVVLGTFERTINEAAAQGYEVQSLNSSQQQGAPPDVIVLLRRPRK